jgi:putative membrane protein
LRCLRLPGIMPAMNELASVDAKARVATAITAIEKKTSAEVVVSMRPASGSYLHADLLAGAVSALAYLCVFLYHPEPFDFTYFPIEQALCFVLAAVACSRLAPLRRLLTGRKTRERNVELAAKAMFVDRGITKTRSRTGVLVYLSVFERDVAVVLDVGLDAARLGEPYARAARELRAEGARRNGSIDDFVKALDAVGAALAEAYPIEDDDVDELPNEVAA